MRQIQRIGIVGCGQIGCGIARVAALAGYDVQICEISEETLERSFVENLTFFRRLSMRGALNEEDVRDVFARIHGSIQIEDLQGAELIIEAVPEDFSQKIKIFQQLDRLCPPPAILASHSISLSIKEIAHTIKTPERVIGLHFLPPVHQMKLVEIIFPAGLSEFVAPRVEQFIRSLKKEPIFVADAPGFVVTRLMLSYLLNAIRIFESGVASKEDIDKAMKLGGGYPMGPFALMDIIGLDTIHRLAEAFYREYHDSQYLAPELLKHMLNEGLLGKKSGQGFYTYPETD